MKVDKKATVDLDYFNELEEYRRTVEDTMCRWVVHSHFDYHDTDIWHKSYDETIDKLTQEIESLKYYKDNFKAPWEKEKEIKNMTVRQFKKWRKT